jgi:hypothetical protein
MPLLSRRSLACSAYCVCRCVVAAIVMFWAGNLFAFEDPDKTIAMKCARDWPDNFRMRAACIEQQRTVLDESLSSPVDPRLPLEDLSMIREKCANDWPEDFRMRVRCEQQQIQGFRKLRLPPSRGITLQDYSVSIAACTKEWPNDFRQRAHCVDEQLATTRRHENFDPLDRN